MGEPDAGDGEDRRSSERHDPQGRLDTADIIDDGLIPGPDIAGDDLDDPEKFDAFLDDVVGFLHPEQTDEG